jgi:hypothetical protein
MIFFLVHELMQMLERSARIGETGRSDIAGATVK